MTRIAVVATEQKYAEHLKENIERYLKKYARFTAFCTEDVKNMAAIPADIIAVSAVNVFQQVREKVEASSEIIVISFALNKRQMEMLKHIPEGSRALLVNFDFRSCMHTISSMYSAGFRNVELTPYYGEGDYDRDIRLAITPNEAHLVPPGIDEVIDVGESSIDLNTLYSLADKLGVYEEFIANEAPLAREEYYYIESGVEKLLNERENLKENLSVLTHMMKDGIMITDVDGKVFHFNREAQRLLCWKNRDLNGLYIQGILPELEMRSGAESLIKAGNNNLVVSSVEIKKNDQPIGFVLTINAFEEREERQHRYRSELSNFNHKAQFTFEDIIGESEAIKRNVEYAKRIARLDSAVMLTGNSGTGKEVFAQSIHNASARAKYNFVAVNCAAIPENLLESEMFGYDEGAFSGAKKGGKTGLFELAHQGTIFLDEIGEMPIALQAKLLRVLEERRIMRVGARKTIAVDVRIIAATNKNLLQMVKEGRFREDLYYRINVLPISLPDLHQRKMDIMPLFYSMQKKMDVRFDVTEGAEKILTNHVWEGNVRELRNAVEFLTSLEKNPITEEDLSALWSGRENSRPDWSSEYGENREYDIASIYENFILMEGHRFELHKEILRVLESCSWTGMKPGRNTIREELNKLSSLPSEGEIRSALRILNDYGFTAAGLGRSGSYITSKGKQLLEYMENCRVGFVGK